MPGKPEKSPFREARNANATERTCLKCNELFNSSSPGNRFCPKCNKKNDDIREDGKAGTLAQGLAGSRRYVGMLNKS